MNSHSGCHSKASVFSFILLFMLSLIELKGEFYQMSEKASEKIRF